MQQSSAIVLHGNTLYVIPADACHARGSGCESAGAGVDGCVIISYAVSSAVEVRRWHATRVLALDPFDEDVRRLWRDRYGFREVAAPLRTQPERRRRFSITLVVPGGCASPPGGA